MVIKQQKEIRKLTTGFGEDYTAECLDYDYIKICYRLTAVDLSWQKELDVDPKVIQQIEFIGQLKIPDNETVANESMFVLTVLEKKNAIKIFSRKCISIIKDSKFLRKES